MLPCLLSFCLIFPRVPFLSALTAPPSAQAFSVGQPHECVSAVGPLQQLSTLPRVSFWTSPCLGASLTTTTTAAALNSHSVLYSPQFLYSYYFLFIYLWIFALCLSMKSEIWWPFSVCVYCVDRYLPELLFSNIFWVGEWMSKLTKWEKRLSLLQVDLAIREIFFFLFPYGQRCKMSING